ncbi:MAG: aspartate kinase, partial [Cyanobacteria bacterium]|nr:aspartate kinase [Cyanobacteriota bacterium]
MSIKILKFGGTSVKNLGRIDHVARIVASGPFDKKIVVVSAMGSTTDDLLKLAKQCSSDPHRRELDLLLSTGEQVSIALLTLTLQSMGIAARAFTGQQIGVLTDDTHGDARILNIDRKILDDALERYDVVVVAGFQGITDDGEITTLGRGGSDTT